MSVGWSCLPLLPLCRILEYLSFEDALAAMSISRHWRSGLLLYEGRRKTLKLNAKLLDKCKFLTRLFKKHTTILQVYVADCTPAELALFMQRVMPQFFDTLKLQEIVFVGPPAAVQQIKHSNVKVDRVVIESLLFKHSDSIENFVLMNCELDMVDDKKTTKIHDSVKYYSRGYLNPSSPADAVLSRFNAETMMFSSLQHILVDYDLVTTDTLETLSQLTSFTQLSFMVCNKKLAHSVDWRRALACYPNGLDVAVNLIGLPEKKLDEVMDIVLVEGMTLTSLKILFCKVLYTPLIKRAVRLYKDTLREFVIVDAPHDTACPRGFRSLRTPEFEACNVNPIILMCWQCTQLRRLVIHGYWVWQYDVLGFVRLRKSLQQLEMSAVYGRPPRPVPTGLPRVRATDAPDAVDASFVRQVNAYTEFPWQPTPWARLHAGLRARATAGARTAYVLLEARRPLGVTLYSQK